MKSITLSPRGISSAHVNLDRCIQKSHYGCSFTSTPQALHRLLSALLNMEKLLQLYKNASLLLLFTIIISLPQGVEHGGETIILFQPLTFVLLQES